MESRKGAGDFLVRSMKKHTVRTKERMLEKLGKSEKTQDELFNEYVNNIGKQQNNALRLQKELKNYLACVKAMELATKSLNDAVTECYESEWPGHSQLQNLKEDLQLLAGDRAKNLGEDLQNNMQLYLNQFEPAKAKISKRNRKLTDFDAARYNLQAQLNAAKRNDAKAAKAQDEHDAAQKLYESINDELHRELPALYDSRLGFYGNTLKTVWESEAAYHTDSGKCYERLAGFANDLAEQGRSSYKIAPSLTNIGRKPTISGPIHQDSITSQTQSITSPTAEFNRDITIKNHESPRTDTHVRVVSPTPGLPPYEAAAITPRNPVDSAPISEPVPLPALPSNPPPVPVERTSSARVYPQLSTVYPQLPTVVPQVPATVTSESTTKVVRLRRPSTPSSDEDHFADPEARSPVSDVKLESLRITHEGSDTEELAEAKMVKKDSKTELNGKRYKILYKVRATNPYSAEDNDELSFEANDIIWVVPYENPEEQDEGWLMGVKESDGRKGVFPANFTKQLPT
ncbi:hypothetical protein RvY_01174 [Ramazzottius varieornatus]|uniref:Uncharacterized protein n=1 Tax=Ramazzottius varieornatus TaxID=947166 RepID=A0A1D1ULF9_RAMVA|nr:hypothetical protein RvY_01174 [Ramazzottius varieornatus]